MDIPHIIAGRFRIECEIGKGGMGTVYRATHIGLERPVAVKIIKPEFASDPTVAERFIREARTMARLRHSNAAIIFDAGHLPDGRHFIVMEYVEGATLSETLAREGRFMPERAVRIAASICDVLSEAHQLGIVHRDLKPSNIMLNDRGVCVLDFGVAKVLATSADATATHATTGSGFIVGTPRYMSPEQCLGQRIGAQSDLYSLGVLLYEMLAGHPPFTDLLPSAVLVKQATAPAPPLLKLRADVPRPLAAAIHMLLSKQQDERPATAAAARKMLEKSIAKPERAPAQFSAPQPFAETVGTFAPRPRALFRTATPLAIIAVLGLFLFLWGRNLSSFANSAERAEPQAAKTSALDRSARGARPPVILPQAPISLEAARRFASATAPNSTNDVHVLRAGASEQIIVALQRGRDGLSQLLVMERRGGRYTVTARTPLDSADFRSATWTGESLDVNGDGIDEALYTGTNISGAASSCRVVLYSPRTRSAYSVRVDRRASGDSRLHVFWSANSGGREAAPYRDALLQRARNASSAF